MSAGSWYSADELVVSRKQGSAVVSGTAPTAGVRESCSRHPWGGGKDQSDSPAGRRCSQQNVPRISGSVAWLAKIPGGAGRWAQVEVENLCNSGDGPGAFAAETGGIRNYIACFSRVKVQLRRMEK